MGESLAETILLTQSSVPRPAGRPEPKFTALLLRIDHELAEQTRSEGCRCGGALHRADYPRKPRGCPRELRPHYLSRLSYCCALCRQCSTSTSVRFLGRRVYLALAVVLVSVRRAGPTPAAARVRSRGGGVSGAGGVFGVSPGRAGPKPAAARLGTQLGVARRTLQRWRDWWQQQFPLTPLWRAACARFMPPVAAEDLPGELLERFTGAAHEVLLRLLLWLSPITVGGMAAIELREGR